MTNLRPLERRTFARLLAAAVAGIAAGGTAIGQEQRSCVRPGCNCIDGGCKGCRCDDKAFKHICKGHNECKGKGGCKGEKGSCAAKNECKGKGNCAAASAKHECSGKNACKGQGGCKGGDAGCAGKNTCKGKGGCAVPVKADHLPKDKAGKSRCNSKNGCKGEHGCAVSQGQDPGHLSNRRVGGQRER